MKRWGSPLGATERRPDLIVSAQDAEGNDPSAGRFMAAMANSSCLSRRQLALCEERAGPYRLGECDQAGRVVADGNAMRRISPPPPAFPLPS